MNFDVPQYIEVEDKIAFQLTAKQLGWFALGGVLMFLAWNFASREFFIFWSAVIVLTCLAMAFLKPYGITLAAFIGYGFLFLIRPKQYIWQRTVNIGTDYFKQPQKEKKQETAVGAKQINDADKLASLLDSHRVIR